MKQLPNHDKSIERLESEFMKESGNLNVALIKSINREAYEESAQIRDAIQSLINSYVFLMCVISGFEKEAVLKILNNLNELIYNKLWVENQKIYPIK